MSESVVRCDHVSKRFRLGEANGTLGDLIARGLRGLLGAKANVKRSETFWAVRDVDFSINRGDALGIIGPNGAGKSTVLKLLAGILRPDGGNVSINGRLAALIEVGAGFHGDLTGRENIFLNGAILGMSRGEIRQKLDAIVAFAGLDRFLDTPVKRYSSGMYARLGFSIASHVDPDVLIVDEVLSVGDAVFRLRCMDRMKQLIRGGTTLIFVTHNLDQMQSICPNAVVLDQGRSVFQGPSREAVGRYLTAMSQAYANRPADLALDGDPTDSAVALRDLQFVDADGCDVVWTRSMEPVRAKLTFELKKPIKQLVVELNMRASVSENLVSINSGRDEMLFDVGKGVHRVELDIANLPVAGGQYFWNVRMWDAALGISLLDTPFRFPLVVDDKGLATGALCVEHEWRCESVLNEKSQSVESVFPVAERGGSRTTNENLHIR